MNSEFLEKIRNILEHLFELFIFILIILITLGSLHVHAAESFDLSSNAGNQTVAYEYYEDGLFRQTNYSIPFTDTNYFYAIAYTGNINSNGWNQIGLYAYTLGSKNIPFSILFFI